MDTSLLQSYYDLQDLLQYSNKYTFDEALCFINWISTRLNGCESDLARSVGRTYYKWRIEIANALSKKQNKTRITNAVAEGINNKIKTIVKSAYGYNNFIRFRNRVMLISLYKK